MDIKGFDLVIPKFGELKLKYLVLDYNGTLASSGKLLDHTKNLLREVAAFLEVYVVTADTFKTVKEELEGLPINLSVISKENGSKDKRDLITRLGRNNCIAIGNGNNDELMLSEAKLAICIMGSEGCAKNALMASDMINTSIDEALMLFIEPNRLKATLRK